MPVTDTMTNPDLYDIIGKSSLLTEIIDNIFEKLHIY